MLVASLGIGVVRDIPPPLGDPEYFSSRKMEHFEIFGALPWFGCPQARSRCPVLEPGCGEQRRERRRGEDPRFASCESC